MPIVYALIARGKTVLAEHTAVAGNAPTVTRLLLQKIPPGDGRMSYVYDACIFHYVVDAGITYLCMADDSRRRVPFAFLEDIRRKLNEAYGERVQTSLAFSLNEDFGPVLQRQMAHYNDPSSDRVSAVKQQVEEVKTSMVENIEKVLERGERIELLVDKTDRLNQQAFRFDRASKQLQRHMLMKKIKMYIILGTILALILLAIAMAKCGVTFAACRAT